MSRLMLRVLGFLSVLSGLPSHGRASQKVLAILVRVLCLSLWTILGTLALASFTNSLIEPDEARKRVAKMLDADFEKLTEDLGGALVLTILDPEGDGSEVGVKIEVKGTESKPIVRSVCSDRTIGDGLCLFRVNTLLESPVKAIVSWWDWLPQGAPTWSVFTRFREVKFPSTAYSISELALEIAARDEDITFTRSKRDQLRSEIERSMELKGLFLPTEADLLLGRQLNGPIQLLIYALGFWSIGVMLFLALGSLLPNFVVRLFDTVELSDTEEPLIPPPSANQTKEEIEIGAGEGNAQPPESATGTDDTVDEDMNDEVVVEHHLLPSPTPWSREFALDPTIDLTSEHQIARYYESISGYFRTRSQVLGTAIDPPILRFRAAATRAVANTGDTSILPSFLDAQRNSIDGYYDARLSSVKFLLWVIPTIGFIGTIIGVGDALSATTGLQAARDLTAATSQSQVSSSMGMAFDTTLVALVVAVIVMLLYYALQGSEERMTVLERNSAEDEVLKMAKFIRKPGDTIDLAQQLISLGVNTEILVRDLELFEKVGPELARTIHALKQHEADLLEIVAQKRADGTRTRPWWTFLWLALTALIFWLLASNGMLGTDLEAIVP